MSYPEPPSSLGNDSVVPYLTDVERAYQHRKRADGETVDVCVGVADSTVEPTDDGFLVSLEIGFSTQDCHDGTLGAGNGSYWVRYYLNETMVYREEFEDEQVPPDPREEGAQLIG
jgi:hypothetical protein